MNLPAAPLVDGQLREYSFTESHLRIPSKLTLAFAIFIIKVDL